MNIAAVMLCTTLYCAPESISMQTNTPTLQSNPQGIQLVAKAKCKSLNKAQCRKRKKCEWRGKANKCLAK